MRLTVQTDYALRLLSHLAANDDRLVTITEVAARFSISKNHMMKVAHLLGRHGMIESVRGRAGGLRLVKQADAVGLGDVVRLMESDFSLVECLSADGGACLITPACRLKGVLQEAMTAFLAVLDRYTLRDLVTQNQLLKDLLEQEAA